MTKEKYLAERKALTDAAQKLIDEGKLEEFEAKKAEIEEIDAAFEASGNAQANLNALAGAPRSASFAAFNANGAVAETVDLGGQVPETDMYDSTEYKNAFMKYVLNGSAMPGKFTNAGQNTKTPDVGTVIPTTTMQKIVEKMESIGMVLPLVTHTSYKGGVAVPTSNVKPVATWVAEGAGSNKQKKTTGSITFSYYKLRCAISMSLEVSIVTYPMFESQFVQNVADAMVAAKEQAIISGDGAGKPKGILAETPVLGQALDIAEGEVLTYADLVAMESVIPQAYDNGTIYAMTKKTFLTQVWGMVDTNGQPIARVNYGINGKPEYSILGRRVLTVGDYMDSFADSVDADTIIAFAFRFSDYILNTNLGLTVSRYTDNDTDDEVLKAIELVDGKVVDKNSLVTLTIKAKTV